jgi:type IV secretion system protein VirB11
MSIKALERHLMPLKPFLKMDGVTEICLNNPKEIYLEKEGRFIRHVVDELEYDFVESLAALIAEFNHKDFPSPLLSGSLLMGERIQFVMNPACESNKLLFSIRRQQMRNMSLDDYGSSGAFDELLAEESASTVDDQLKILHHQKDILGFLRLAILSKKNILISGGTGTGKTTFLNACLKWIPEHERIITVEDAREVSVPHFNVAHLLFNEEDERVTALKIFKTCLRLVLTVFFCRN